MLRDFQRLLFVWDIYNDNHCEEKGRGVDDRQKKTSHIWAILKICMCSITVNFDHDEETEYLK